MRVDQPQSNHNGGALETDSDGYLYISFGDGGNREDEEVGHSRIGNGRNNENPLGAILRINPKTQGSENGQYGIPADNPFINKAGLDEVFAYGFRNVRRLSFDMQENRLYAADHGQYLIEEVNLVLMGENYGWNLKEGEFYFYPNGPIQGYVSNVPHREPIDSLVGSTVDPIAQYDQDDGRNVVGGFVYRGKNIADLNNLYIFADANGRIFYRQENAELFELQTSLPRGLRVESLIQGNDNEIYILGANSALSVAQNGVLMRLTGVTNKELCLPILAKKGFAVVCL
jgi:glucose/arabinose dehydrogenase